MLQFNMHRHLINTPVTVHIRMYTGPVNVRMYVRSLNTYRTSQSVIEVSVIAVDDVSPSSGGGLSEVRELVGVHAVVAPHCLTATEVLTQLHIPAQDGGRGGGACNRPLGEEHWSILIPYTYSGYR